MTSITNERLRSRLLTIPEVAARMRVSTKTVRRLIERGALRVHRIGRAIRVTEEEIVLLLHRSADLTTSGQKNTSESIK